MHPHIHCTLSLSLGVESSESLYHRPTPWDVEEVHE